MWTLEIIQNEVKNGFQSLPRFAVIFMLIWAEFKYISVSPN